MGIIYERRDIFDVEIAVSEFQRISMMFSWFLSLIRRCLTLFYRNQALTNPLLLNRLGRSYGTSNRGVGLLDSLWKNKDVLEKSYKFT